MDQHNDRQPKIMLLWFEESLFRFFTEILKLEDYSVISACTAAEALAICEHKDERCVVLIDNYHLNEQAVNFAKTVFARSELHVRVKVVGLATARWERLVDLDGFIQLPFTVDSFLTPIEELCRELRTGG